MRIENEKISLPGHTFGLDLDQLMELIRMEDPAFNQAVMSEVVPQTSGAEGGEAFLQFLQRLRSLFKSGKPVDQIRSVISDPKSAQDFFVNGGSHCPFAAKTKMEVSDLSQLETLEVNAWIEPVQRAFSNLEKMPAPLRSVVIKLPAMFFKTENTEEAHFHNHEVVFEISCNVAAALNAVANPSNSPQQYKQSIIEVCAVLPGSISDIVLNFSPAPAPVDHYMQMLKGMDFFDHRDALETIVMGPCYDEDDTRYAPEFVFVANKQRDLATIPPKKRDEEIGRAIKIAHMKKMLETFAGPVPDDVSADQIVNIYAGLVEEEKIPYPLYSATMSVSYKNPFQSIPKEEIEALLRANEDMMDYMSRK